MAQFNNPEESHTHSLEVLDLIRNHDSFTDSILSVADMGCGGGLDINWWATLETRDDPPQPHNYKCYAVDLDPKQVIEFPENVQFINKNFEERVLSTQVDVMWCHDSFQYATNPLRTLKLFNEQMNVNGLLYIGIPLQHYNEFNHWNSVSRNFAYYNHSFLSLVYMLAVNGFDCNDAYFRKAKNDMWLHAAVFKTDIKPMDPRTTSWYTLSEKGLINDSLRNSLSKFGYVRQQDALYPWLDKDFHLIEL